MIHMEQFPVGLVEVFTLPRIDERINDSDHVIQEISCGHKIKSQTLAQSQSSNDESRNVEKVGSSNNQSHHFSHLK